MSDDANKKRTITPANVLKGESPLVLTASLETVAGDRFQPAGFPEIGHVIYKAPRKDGPEKWVEESVCIVDSAASMANHLESVCLRSAHDLDLVDDLMGMPYLRCVTGKLDKEQLEEREVVVTSLTEGHRIASTYFLAGQVVNDGGRIELERAPDGAHGKRKKSAKKEPAEIPLLFERRLEEEFGIKLPSSSKAHPPPDKWWNVFKTIFKYDPNALVHGVLFPQWQIKIPRVLTAHLEAFGAGRVDRSGVKFDRLGKTASGQPIFAVDDATAKAIRATFVLDVSLVRSFGRLNGEKQLGLTDLQKEFLVALALWKIQRLLDGPFRFRSGCHLKCVSVTAGGHEAELDVPIRDLLEKADFTKPPITDVYWPREELYREGKEEGGGKAGDSPGSSDQDDGERNGDDES